MREFFRPIIKNIYKVLMIITYRPKIVGRENLPQDTAAIICPNHVHALDSTVIISMNKRPIKTLAKEELFRNRFFRFIANVFGIYPVKPKDGAIKLAIKANVPIVPVGVQGDFKPFRKIKINIGKPIYYSKYKEEINNREVLEQLTENLMKNIVKLRDENI